MNDPNELCELHRLDDHHVLSDVALLLEARGIDADVWTGFAFGFGIDRCAQMRHQIADMRALIENDIRFLRQF